MAAIIQSSNRVHLTPTSLLVRLGRLLHTSQWSDCTFVVGDGPSKQEFRAHRILLASSSPVFEAMCFGPLAETEPIAVPDVEPAAFRVLLQYVYTENAQFSSVEEACDVLYVAKKYMLSTLSQVCHLYIKRNMQVNDVIAVYEYAKLLQEEDLYEPCLLMMRKYALEVLSDNVHHISATSVAELLASDAINGCECCLIEGALSWAKRECEQRGLQAAGETMRSVLEKAGAWLHLRFLTLSAQQFSHVCQLNGLFAAEEITVIKEYISQVAGCGDEQRAMSCGNMCNNSTSSAPHVEEAQVTSNSNVVIVRDKWKRRRVNMVLIGSVGHSTPEVTDYEVAESADVPVRPVAPLLLTICSVIKPRLELGYSLSFCRRPLMKQSLTISGPLMLKVVMRVSSPIDLRAIQLYTRLIPSSAALYKTNTYTEKLELEISDETNKPLAQQSFSEKVEYNTEVTVHLKKFVRLTQDRNYNIVVKILDCVAEYPLSFLGQSARSQGIHFEFLDCVAKPESSFVNRLDMGFIRGFAYS